MAQLFFTGQLHHGVTRAEALSRLALSFQKPKETFFPWFRTSPHCIRANLTHEKAHYWQSRVEACGLSCEIRPEPKSSGGSPSGFGWWGMLVVISVVCLLLGVGGWAWTRPNPVLMVYITLEEDQAMSQEVFTYALQYGGHVRVTPALLFAWYPETLPQYALSDNHGQCVPHGTLANFIIQEYGWRFHGVDHDHLLFTRR